MKLFSKCTLGDSKLNLKLSIRRDGMNDAHIGLSDNLWQIQLSSLLLVANLH